MQTYYKITFFITTFYQEVGFEQEVEEKIWDYKIEETQNWGKDVTLENGSYIEYISAPNLSSAAQYAEDMTDENNYYMHDALAN